MSLLQEKGKLLKMMKPTTKGFAGLEIKWIVIRAEKEKRDAIARAEAAERAAAQTPAAPEPGVESNPKRAMIELRDYLRTTKQPRRAFGYRGHPSPEVIKAQRAVGFTGDDVDGIVGPKLRAKAASLGVTLPQRRSA